VQNIKDNKEVVSFGLSFHMLPLRNYWSSFHKIVVIKGLYSELPSGFNFGSYWSNTNLKLNPNSHQAQMKF
jgi:hypothetical protein